MIETHDVSDRRSWRKVNAHSGFYQACAQVCSLLVPECQAMDEII